MKSHRSQRECRRFTSGRGAAGVSRVPGLLGATGAELDVELHRVAGRMLS